MSNQYINLLIELPKTFSFDDVESIRKDLFDFFEKKKYYGANYGKKEGIKIKVVFSESDDK